jgi:hypothetical protein
MRIVTHPSERGDRARVLRDGRVVDAWEALWRGAAAPPTVRALLEADLVPALAELARHDLPQGSPLGSSLGSRN